jgi:hypothetical protein
MLRCIFRTWHVLRLALVAGLGGPAACRVLRLLHCLRECRMAGVGRWLADECRLGGSTIGMHQVGLLCLVRHSSLLGLAGLSG